MVVLPLPSFFSSPSLSSSSPPSWGVDLAAAAQIPFPIRPCSARTPSWPWASQLTGVFPELGNMLEHLVQLLPFQMGKLRGSEFLEVPTDGLRFHLRSAERGAALGPVPGACPSPCGSWEGLFSAGRAQRNTVSAPGCGSALSWLHSYLFVCLCVCE